MLETSYRLGTNSLWTEYRPMSIRVFIRDENNQAFDKVQYYYYLIFFSIYIFF